MKALIIFLLFAMNIIADDNYQKNIECERIKISILEKTNSLDEAQIVKNVECQKNNTNKKYKNFIGEFDTLLEYWVKTIFGIFGFVFFAGLGIILLLFLIQDIRSNFPMNGA